MPRGCLGYRAPGKLAQMYDSQLLVLQGMFSPLFAKATGDVPGNTVLLTEVAGKKQPAAQGPGDLTSILMARLINSTDIR